MIQRLIAEYPKKDTIPLSVEGFEEALENDPEFKVYLLTLCIHYKKDVIEFVFKDSSVLQSFESQMKVDIAEKMIWMVLSKLRLMDLEAQVKTSADLFVRAQQKPPNPFVTTEQKEQKKEQKKTEEQKKPEEQKKEPQEPRESLGKRMSSFDPESIGKRKVQIVGSFEPLKLSTGFRPYYPPQALLKNPPNPPNPPFE